MSSTRLGPRPASGSISAPATSAPSEGDGIIVTTAAGRALPYEAIPGERFVTLTSNDPSEQFTLQLDIPAQGGDVVVPLFTRPLTIDNGSAALAGSGGSDVSPLFTDLDGCSLNQPCDIPVCLPLYERDIGGIAFVDAADAAAAGDGDVARTLQRSPVHFTGLQAALGAPTYSADFFGVGLVHLEAPGVNLAPGIDDVTMELEALPLQTESGLQLAGGGFLHVVQDGVSFATEIGLAPAVLVDVRAGADTAIDVRYYHGDVSYDGDSITALVDGEAFPSSDYQGPPAALPMLPGDNTVTLFKSIGTTGNAVAITRRVTISAP